MVNVRHLLFSLAGLGASVSSFAQIWDGGSGTGAYGTANNWNPNGVPGNVVINFDGANANSQHNINLGATRTVAGIVFFSAAGVNPFTFSNNQFNIGSSGIVNNDADTQVFSSSLAISVGADQIWNASAGNLRFDSTINVNSANTLTLDGSKDFTFTGIINGGGSIIKQGSGTVFFSDPGGSFSGPFTLQAGSVIGDASGSWSVPHNLSLNGGGLFQLSPGGNFEGLDGTVTVSGGTTVRFTPGGEITGIVGAGSMTFGATGGTLDLGAPLAAGTSLGSVVVNSAAGTPAIIKYGTIADSSTSPFGWDTSGNILNVANGNLGGAGALSFQLSNGAMVSYNQSSFSGSLNFTGVSGGSASAGSSAANVGRLMLDSAATFSVANGLTFDNAMQVTINGGPRTLDANITVNSGNVAFQGRSKSSAGLEDLTIGSTVGGKTLTVKDGATATMDLRFRNESTLNNVGGIVLNANTVLEAGGGLNFTKSATVGGEVVDSITVNGDITGQGTTAKESLLTLNTSSFSFTAGAGTAGSDLIVNGSGLGGLRIEGTKARVDALLTAQRFQDLTGSGGTLTVAYTDSGTRTFTADPNINSMVRLGFDAVAGSTPTYQLGAAINDMVSWGGLVVKGGTVRVMFNESMTGSSGITTSLDLLGGSLILHNGAASRTLTFEGGANLTAGTLSGGAGAGGTLVIGGNLVAGPSLSLANTPNITMNVSGPAAVSGSPIVGIGTYTKQGNGTVTLNTSLSANTIDIKAGTLLLGGPNLIGDSTAMKLSGGSFATGGQNETLGTLTLAANSTIDLGSNASILNFANSSGAAWTSSTTLTIANWSQGSDQLFFGSAMSALSAGQVSQIQFLNPNGLSGIWAATILSTGEIVPVPEPATIGFGALLLGSLGLRERRRLTQFVRALRGVWRKIVAA